MDNNPQNPATPAPDSQPTPEAPELSAPAEPQAPSLAEPAPQTSDPTLAEPALQTPKAHKKPLFIALVAVILLLAGLAIFLVHDHLENQRLDAESVTLEENLTVEFNHPAKVSDFLAELQGELVEDFEINTERLGDQEITFEYINIKNRKRPSKFTIEVIDATKPSIFGGSAYTVYTGYEGDLTNLMLSADDIDDNPTREIRGDYDLDKPGSYTLEYAITDASGNEAVKSFILNVIDPPTTTSNEPEPEPELMNISDIIKTHKTKNTKIGVDVSQWQGDIDWAKAKSDGVEFAMLRIGYQRGFGGEYILDPTFESNFKNAKANNLPLGIYFYSYADSPAEAQAQADWILKTLDEVARANGLDPSLELGIAFDWESWVYFNGAGMSLYTINKVAETFLQTVQTAGYKPLLYSSKNYLDLIWQPETLAEKLSKQLSASNGATSSAAKSTFDVWLAQYYDRVTYDGDYQIWQMTDSGAVAGIDGPVDVDILYLEEDE